MSLAASVSQTFSGATYTMELTVPRAELLARAWAGAQDAAGQMKVGRPGTPVLVLPVGDGDPVQVRVGVFHGGSVYDREGRQFKADMRTGGVYVHFSGDDLVGDSQRQAMVDWLAEHGYDSTGEPWAVLAAGGVEEVRWPVRPVRDSESFIGRHGVRVAIPDPDGCLVADQEIHDRTVERIPELIGRFEAGTARPNTLERICMEALAAARLAQIPTPDDPAVIRWLTLAGRAGLAELTCRATGSPLELELDGRPVAVRAGTSQLLYGNRMIDTLLAALAVADPVAVRLLRDLPLDALRAAPARPEEYILSRAAALRALSRGDWQARPAVRAVLSASQASAQAWGAGPWFSHMEVPVWRLGLALLDGDPAAFTAAQRDALLAHRRWWGHTQANPGELQDHNPEGYLSLGATCFAALYVEEGGELTPGSEYLPGCVLDSARQRQRAGPDARAWPGPPDAAAEAEHRRASERDRMLARQAAASYVAGRFPDAEPLLEWPHDRGGVGAEPTGPGFRADDLDGMWQRPGPDGPRLIAISVSGGDHPLPEVVPEPGAPALPAGTRDYLRLAAERVRADGRAELADTLARETLAGRLTYLHVATDPGAGPAGVPRHGGERGTPGRGPGRGRRDRHTGRAVHGDERAGARSGPVLGAPWRRRRVHRGPAASSTHRGPHDPVHDRPAGRGRAGAETPGPGRVVPPRPAVTGRRRSGGTHRRQRAGAGRAVPRHAPGGPPIGAAAGVRHHPPRRPPPRPRPATADRGGGDGAARQRRPRGPCAGGSSIPPGSRPGDWCAPAPSWSTLWPAASVSPPRTAVARPSWYACQSPLRPRHRRFSRR